MEEAMQALVDIQEEGLMTPNGEDGYAMFQGNQVLFSSDGTWSSLAFDQVEDLNYGVTNIYSFDPDNFHNRSSARSEEHTSELQSRFDLVCRLLLEIK